MSGYDGMTGFYVAIASGKVKYAKPGDTKLTEVKLTKKAAAPGATVAPAPETAPTYTNEDGSITMTVTYGKNPLEDSTGTVLMWVGIVLGIFGVICIILIVVWRASSRNDDGYIRVDESGDGDTISEPPIRRASATRFEQAQAPLPSAPPPPQASQAPPSAQAFGSRHHSRSYGQSRPLRPSRSSLQSHRRI
jgi:hypothetical protein